MAPHLPSPHLYGDAVLSELFNMPAPYAVEIYDTEQISTDGLRVYFDLATEQSVHVSTIRHLGSNADYWVRTATARCATIDADVPVEEELRLVNDDMVDVIRVLHYAVRYPWTSIAFDIHAIRERIDSLAPQAKAGTAVQALFFGYASLDALLAAAN